MNELHPEIEARRQTMMTAMTAHDLMKERVALIKEIAEKSGQPFVKLYEWQRWGRGGPLGSISPGSALDETLECLQNFLDALQDSVRDAARDAVMERWSRDLKDMAAK